MDYLIQLGVGSVYLSSIYKSGGKDNGFDITNHEEIDPQFGSLEDFKEMIQAMHDNGIKLIMDFVPNHSSDKHEWFQKSVKREDPYTNYYVWQPCTRGTKPNNWVMKTNYNMK